MKFSGKKTSAAGRAGFTLIELLVVISITILLSSILITYSHSSRQQIAMYAEKTKLAGMLFNAKSLSISFYKPASTDYCGYGVHVDYSAQTYSLFRYVKGAITNCSAITSFNAASEETISTVKADPNVKLIHPTSGPWLDNVLFVPPNPVTLISSNGSIVRSGDATVVIQTLDGALSNSIGINPAGLINL